MTNSRLSLPCLLLLAWPSLAAAADDSADQRLLAGLRQRGLYRLAETYCTERLDPQRHPNLPGRQRADLVIELSRCLAERAVSSPPEVRPPLWQRALEATDTFARQYAQSPRLPQVRLQGALGLLARGELTRQEAEVTADPAALLRDARTHLRAAIQTLEELADDVDRRMRQQNLAGRSETAALTADELLSIGNNVQYQLARALRNQAACYGPQSADRANSLTRAIGLLQPLARLDPVNPLAWQSRLDLVAGHRLLADFETARRQLDVLTAMKPSPSVAWRARAQRIRLELATGRVGEAIGLVPKTLDLDGTTSADLDYAVLEAYLAAGSAATDNDNNVVSTQWQARATDLLERIERLHGPYWTRRAGMLVSRYVRATSAGGDLAMLVRAAESSFRSGRPDDALNTYDKARQLAASQGNADRVFELGYIAATIQHQRDRHRDAMTRYRQIATDKSKHAGAPGAHLLAIHHAAQLAREQPQTAPDEYASLLAEHLQLWPRGPDADKVRRRMARLHEHQRRWKDAIDAYRRISPGAAEHLAAVEAAARCYRAWFDQRKAAGEPSDRIAVDAADAAAWLERLALASHGAEPPPWNPVRRSAAVEAARLWLNYTPAGFPQAQTVLSAAIEGATDAPAEWTSTARALLVFSLAGGGQHGEAGEVLQQISAGPPEGLLNMIEGLGRLAATAPPGVRTRLAQLQLRAVELLGPRHGELSKARQEQLKKTHARALADAGRTGEALAAYKLLAEKHPSDGATQEGYARLLLTRKDPASMQTALKKWRELENKSPPRSPRWFRAKYEVASLHYDLGNKQQAAKIIRLLKLLHPDLGGPEMKADFEELLKRCRQ